MSGGYWSPLSWGYGMYGNENKILQNNETSTKTNLRSRDYGIQRQIIYCKIKCYASSQSCIHSHWKYVTIPYWSNQTVSRHGKYVLWITIQGINTAENWLVVYDNLWIHFLWINFYLLVGDSGTYQYQGGIKLHYGGRQ